MKSIHRILTAGLAAVLALPALTQAAHYGMPEQGSYQGKPYFSGGFGVDGREHLMKTVASDYNLKLEFALEEGNYVGDVNVEIMDQNGNKVMGAMSKGPWFFTRLDPGKYTVEVSGFGQQFSDTVQVPASGLAEVVFADWDHEKVLHVEPKMLERR